MRYIAWLLPLLLVACNGDTPSGQNDEENGHDDHSTHVHYSTHGGMRVEVGDHLGSLDLVLDAEAGELHGYILDGHMTKPVRLTTEAFFIRAKVDGKDVTLTMRAQADELSGETVGDTAHFMAKSDALKGAKTLSGVVEKLNMYGQDFENIAFTYKPDPSD